MDGKPKHHERRSKSTKPDQRKAPRFRAMKMEVGEPKLAVHDLEIKGGLSDAGAKSKGPKETFRFDRKPSKHRGWDKPQLTVLGLYYPLGPCKTPLILNDLNEVLSKLEKAFRMQSLHTTFVDSPISAVCKSLDQVELEVVLFEARDEPEKMIIDINRLDGDSYSFHSYAQHILCSVLGIESESPPGTSPSWNINLLSQADSIGPGVENVGDALEISFNLMKTDRYDSKKLGLEALVHMTNPTKSGWSAAKAVAGSLIRPDGAVAEQLTQIVLKLACKSVVVESSDPSLRGFSDADFAYLSLVIIAQILEVAAGAQTMDVKTFLDVCPADLVGSVIEKVRDVQSDPHRAYYAVQCLASLCRCVPSTKMRINGSDVEEARLVGDSCHLALATATQKLLGTLQA